MGRRVTGRSANMAVTALGEDYRTAGDLIGTSWMDLSGSEATCEWGLWRGAGIEPHIVAELHVARVLSIGARLVVQNTLRIVPLRHNIRPSP